MIIAWVIIGLLGLNCYYATYFACIRYWEENGFEVSLDDKGFFLTISLVMPSTWVVLVEERGLTAFFDFFYFFFHKTVWTCSRCGKVTLQEPCKECQAKIAKQKL